MLFCIQTSTGSHLDIGTPAHYLNVGNEHSQTCWVTSIMCTCGGEQVVIVVSRLVCTVQAIAMDEDAELAGMSDQMGPKAGIIPAGAMMANPGDQTNRKIPLETAPSESKSVMGRTSQDPPLLPARSGTHNQPALPCSQPCTLPAMASDCFNAASYTLHTASLQA